MEPHIKIFLPLHVSSADVFLVISKALDEENWKIPFNKKVNINSPCSIGNVWDVAFNHSPYTMQQFVDEHHDIFKVKDIMDQKYDLYFYHSGTVNGHTVGEEKLIIAPANALMGAIGIKLLEFYSGKMIVCNLPNVVSDKNGVNSISEYFSSKHPAPIKKRSAKKYRYQFTNNLAELTPINPQELVEMRKKNLWKSTDHVLLYNMDEKFAQSYFNMEDLTSELSQPTIMENQSVKKIKI